MSFFFLILTVGYLNAQIPVDYNDFSGGLNDWDAYLKINESPNVQNFFVDEIGGLSKRHGFRGILNLPLTGIPIAAFRYSLKQGDNRLMVFADNGRLYETIVYSTGAYSSFTTVRVGLSTSTTIDCTTVRANLWCVQESTNAFTWNGSTIGFVNSAPKGSYIAFAQERVWIAKTTDAPSDVFYTNLVDPAGNFVAPDTSTSAWPAANQLSVSRNDGDVLMGIKAYRGTVFLFKERSIHYISGYDEFSYGVLPVRYDAGTTSNHSIVEVNGILNVLDKKGLYEFDGRNITRFLTTKSDLFKTINHDFIISSTTLTDNFSNFNTNNWGVLKSSWQANGGALTSTPTTGSCSGSADDCPSIRTASSQTDGIWKFDIRVPAATGYTADVCFMTTTDCNPSNAGNRYYLEFTATDTILKKNSGTSIAGAQEINNGTIETTSTVKILKQNASIKVFIDDRLIIDANDSDNSSSSYFSIFASMNQSMVFDNFDLFQITPSTFSSDVPIKAWGANWKDRYWLSYSRIGQRNKDRIIVKSREPSKAIVLMTGMNFNAMVPINEQIYAIDSATDDVHQMDIGYSDNGTAIDSIWESRNEDAGQPFSQKNIKFMYVYYQNYDDSSFTLGYSRNQGKSYTQNTLTHTGITIPSYLGEKITRRTDFNPRDSVLFRTRVRHNTDVSRIDIFRIVPVFGITSQGFPDLAP